MIDNPSTLYRLLVCALVLVLAASCDDGTSCPPGEICDCPAPYDDSFGPLIPKYSHTDPKLSPDGRTLGFLSGGTTLRLLDLQTGQVRTLDVWNRLPQNVQLIGCGNYAWCPYDNNRLLLHCVTVTDTVGDGKHYEYGHNLYITSIDGSEFQRVTPDVYGSTGAAGGIGMTGWLMGSTPDRDSIHLGWALGIFIRQIQTFVPANNYRQLLRQSRANGYWFSINRSTASGFPDMALLNNSVVTFSQMLPRFDYASWSPNGRKLALSVYPQSERKVYAQVWIVDVERFLREQPSVVPVEVIDFQRRFCTYNRWGVDAEFITDSTLAVSMHEDGAELSALWEITTDGRRKRQLTFVP